MSSGTDLVKGLIDQGMGPIRADLDRFAAGMRGMTAASETAPPAALRAVRSAREHADAAQAALKAANQGHIRLIPGGGQAIRAFLYLGQGLTILEQALTSSDPSAVSKLSTQAKGLIDRANDELFAADRALGCPYGCRKTPTTPKPGARS